MAVTPSSPPFAPSVRTVLVFAWLVILGGKLATIGAFGTDLPYWDQWAKEGEHILMPWFRGQSFLTGLVSAHNEHRIVPTLLLNLGLVVGGGQWDARVQCIASAGVHATVLVGLVGWAWRRVGRHWGLAALGLAALIGALPIAWDNVLGGFQSQYYFLAGASLLAMERLLSAPVARLGWWVGLGFGLVALICMGSGLLVAVPVLGIVLLRAVRREPRGRDHVVTFLAAALVLGVGLWLHAAAPWHATLRAKGVADFMLYVVRSMAWPVPGVMAFALLVWGPWVVLAVRRILGHRAPGDDVLIAAGLWVLLQFAAVAYSRAGGSTHPAARYGDISSLGLLLGFLSLASVTTAWPATRRRVTSWVTGGCAVVALVAAVIPVWNGDLPVRKGQYWAFEDAVRRFVADDNFAEFEKRPLPFPLADWLARILRDPGIRAAMPASAGVSLAGESQVTVARAGDGAAEPRVWASQPVRPGAPYWRMEFAGAFDPRTAHLTVRDEAGVVLRSVPWPAAGAGPRAEIMLAAPSVSSRLELRLEGPADEVTLVLPRAVSRLSWAGWRLASWGWTILGIAAAGAFISAVQVVRRGSEHVTEANR